MKAATRDRPTPRQLAAQATWLRRWRVGEVFIAVGELNGRPCCVESLPEHAQRPLTTAAAALKGSAAVPALVPLAAVEGPVAFYTGLPGQQRLADAIVNPPGHAAERAGLVAAVESTGRRLADLHGRIPKGATGGIPPHLSHLRERLNTEALLRCRSALFDAPSELRPHLAPLLDGQWTPWPADALLHAAFAPAAVFAPEGAGPGPRFVRWVGATAGDPMYDLGTFLGPLTELMTEHAAIRVDRGLVRRFAEALVAGYVDDRGRALSADERFRLRSRTLLDLASHLCRFATQVGWRGCARRYVDGIAELTVTDPLLGGVVAA